ncbi:Hypothetical predicted protein [Paramuricea clavata]|uniref:Uncharacterized protein n=1 Tax=Paramuricea clavata TaxID=317549 RepID=A0A6S7HG13_PARCT|nr:Hypothetical predicted protein [Paramuricea clavata]
MSIELFTIPGLLGAGEITTVKSDDGTIYFAAKEIAAALGYIRTQNAIDRHTEEWMRTTLGEIKRAPFQGPFCVSGSIHPGRVFVTEPGLYSLVFGSKLSSAKDFQRWVFKDVLPSIRKTGKYALPGVVGKLKSIEDSELYRLEGPERTEVKSELTRKTNLMKDPEAVLRGKKGGLVAQENNRQIKIKLYEKEIEALVLEEELDERDEKIRELEDENEKLWIENKKLKER